MSGVDENLELNWLDSRLEMGKWRAEEGEVPGVSEGTRLRTQELDQN